MVQPINYSIDVQDPSQAFLTAFRTGSAITESRMAQEKAERDAKQQEQIQLAFERLRQPGATAKDYADLSMLLPETQAKAVRESFSMINADQQQNALLRSGQIFSALKSGQPDIAIGLIDQQIEAKRNSGDQAGASFLETWRDVARENPKAVEDYFGFTISQIPGGDKVIEAVVKLEADRRAAQLQPAEVAKKTAEAQSAATAAKFAESKAIADLNLTNAQISNYASQQDIARANLEIAKLNADLNREQNLLKKQELQQKIVEATQARDEKVALKESEASGALGSFDMTLNTVDKLLKNWGRDKKGNVNINKPNGTVESATGPISTRLPTLSQDTADFEEQVATLGSQVFMSQVQKMRGLGALTDKEGARLEGLLGSLNLRQSPKQLGENLVEIQRLLLKARTEVERKYGVKVPPDRPEGPGASVQTTPPATPTTPPMPSGFRVLGVRRQ
jgi:hypothetical protein